MAPTPHVAPDLPATSLAGTFTYIKADPFFRDYAPAVKNYKRKILGTNTRGNPLQFSEADVRAVREGLERLFSDISPAGDVIPHRDD